MTKSSVFSLAKYVTDAVSSTLAPCNKTHLMKFKLWLYRSSLYTKPLTPNEVPGSIRRSMIVLSLCIITPTLRDTGPDV